MFAHPLSHVLYTVARSALAAALAVPAGGAAMLISSAVDNYAVHLCGWPATISCSQPGPIWRLVPLWFAAGLVIAVAALVAWVWIGSNGFWGWVLAGWIVLFPMVVFFSGPRQFGLADLIVLGGYAGLAIEFTRRLVLDWGLLPPRYMNSVAFGAAVLYVVGLAAMPTYLAGRASL